jgi:transcriptional regulator with XRE-family HTH domain
MRYMLAHMQQIPTATTPELVGARVKAELQKQGLTQVALAHELNATENFVSRRLRGEVDFNLTELTTVAEILDVPVEQFLRGAA